MRSASCLLVLCGLSLKIVVICWCSKYLMSHYFDSAVDCWLRFYLSNSSQKISMFFQIVLLETR